MYTMYNFSVLCTKFCGFQELIKKIKKTVNFKTKQKKTCIKVELDFNVFLTTGSVCKNFLKSNKNFGS